MAEIEDIWNDDEFEEFENQNMDWRERSMRKMAMNQRKREREQAKPRNDQ